MPEEVSDQVIELTTENKTPNWRAGEKGVSGNPAGRPKGARSKISEAFLEGMQEDFEKHGAEVIEAARVLDPVAYLKVVAGLVPKEIDLKADGVLLGVVLLPSKGEK